MAEKMSNSKGTSTAKIALWYIVSSIFGKGLAVLTTPIFTRIMSQTVYGQFSNITSWESVLTVLVTLDLISSIARAKYDFNERINEYLSSILFCSNIVTLVIYFCVEANRVFFEQLFKMDIFYIRILFLYLLFVPAFNYLQVKHRMYQKYKFFVAASMGSAIVRTGISIILVILLDNKLFARTIGYFIPITVLNLGFWAFIMVKGKRISFGCMKYACKISLPLIPHDLAGMLLGSVDKIMITGFCGSEATAVYSIAYTVSMLAYVIQNAMNQAWTPWLFDNMNAGKKIEIKKSSVTYISVYAVMAVGIMLLSPEAVFILGGKSYETAKYAMPPIILGCIYQFFYTFFVNIEIFQKKTFTISIGTISAALLNLLLNRLLIPKFGYLAAAYTTAIGYLALLIFHYLIVWYTAKEYLQFYHRTKMFVIVVGLSFTAVFTSFLYNWYLIRYLFVALYTGIVIWQMYKYRTVLWKVLH